MIDCILKLDKLEIVLKGGWQQFPTVSSNYSPTEFTILIP